MCCAPHAGDTIEDALDGLHNNGLTPFAAHHQRQLSGGQDGGGGGGPGTAPSSIAPSSMTEMQSCDIDLLDVSELPANPPHSAAAPVSAPPPGLLSAEAMAGIPVYAEPSHFNPAALHGHPHHLPPARGLPLLAGMGHFHHAGGLHPALAHSTAQHLHASGLAHPGMAAFHQPLLDSPAMVLTRPGAAAQGLATQHAAAAVAAAAAQHAAAAQAQQQQAQQPAAGPAPIATQAAPGSHTSSGGGAPGSPSFLQAALAIIKSDADRLSGGSNCPSGGHHRSGSSGEDPTSGNLASLGSGGAGAGSPRSAFAAPAAAGVAGLPGAAAGSPFAAIMGLAALQPVAVQQAAGPGSPTGARGARPQRQAAQNAATILTKAGSEALSVQGARNAGFCAASLSDCGAAAQQQQAACRVAAACRVHTPLLSHSPVLPIWRSRRPQQPDFYAAGLGCLPSECVCFPAAADDDEQGSYTDDQATPRGARKGKGATRPRSNAAYDALIDPSLPPEEARRMRRCGRWQGRRRYGAVCAVDRQATAAADLLWWAGSLSRRPCAGLPVA